MRSWIVPGRFDGAKFAARYGLNAFAGDFSMVGDVLTVVPDYKITDDPPIFEPPDPPGPSLIEQIDALPSNLPPELKLILKRLATGR